MPPDHTTETIHFYLRFKTLIPNRKDCDYGFSPQLDSFHLVVYTDGSKMNSGSGVGIYSEGLNLEATENLGAFAAVFQTEIFAITLTAREKIVIWSNSQAADELARAKSDSEFIGPEPAVGIS